MIEDKRNFKRGEIYMANLNPYKGSEQGGIRPVIILQNNIGNLYSPTLVVAPLTSRFKKKYIPTHFIIENVGALKDDSLVLLEQIKTIDKCRIKNYVGTISKEEMKKLEEGIKVSLGLTIPVEQDVP